VKRSAVTQWENAHGTTPSVEHLIRIAIEAGVSFEWIATGRGENHCTAELAQAVVMDDYAMDADESKALGYLHGMTTMKKRIALEILEVLAR
jgi:transcriptional regulator with XRE-family HTH domain